jgi:hypothetical protein
MEAFLCEQPDDGVLAELRCELDGHAPIVCRCYTNKRSGMGPRPRIWQSGELLECSLVSSVKRLRAMAAKS